MVDQELLEAIRLVVRGEISETRNELYAAISGTKEELYAAISGTKEELYAAISETKEELHTAIAQTKETLTQSFSASIAETKHNLYSAMAENNEILTKNIVSQIDEKIKQNNLAIGNIVTQAAEHSEEKIVRAVTSINDEFKPVIAQNCVDITMLRSKA